MRPSGTPPRGSSGEGRRAAGPTAHVGVSRPSHADRDLPNRGTANGHRRPLSPRIGQQRTSARRHPPRRVRARCVRPNRRTTAGKPRLLRPRLGRQLVGTCRPVRPRGPSWASRSPPTNAPTRNRRRSTPQTAPEGCRRRPANSDRPASPRRLATKLPSPTISALTCSNRRTPMKAPPQERVWRTLPQPAAQSRPSPRMPRKRRPRSKEPVHPPPHLPLFSPGPTKLCVYLAGPWGKCCPRLGTNVSR